MKLTANDIKQALAQDLEKCGHSLYDLEGLLSQKPTLEKFASLLKPVGVSDLASSLKTLVSGLGAGAIGTGALAGLGLYAGYRANQDSTDAIKKKMQEKLQYEEARQSLLAAMQQAQQQPM